MLIVEQFVHMALENTDRADVVTKGEVVLEGRSSELAAGSEELLGVLSGRRDPGDGPRSVRPGNGKHRRRRARAG